VVVGATGNVGTSVLTALAGEPRVDSVLGLARRVPAMSFPKTEWGQADVARSPDLAARFAGADAVVHLAWLIQPGRDRETLRAVNVDGSRRVFRAAVDAGVPALVYASSVGTYAPGPKDRAVDESWPATGVESSFYSRHKAEVEDILDRVERETPSLRVVRLRPGLSFKHEAASEIRRLFAGPFLPSSLVRPALIPVVPDDPRLVFQAVHSHDVGDAYRLAVVGDARGAFNVAADPVLDPGELARALSARRVRIPGRALRAGAAVSWRLRLQPSEPGWVDMALNVPVMDCRRAGAVLGWRPKHSSVEALRELIDGIRERAGIDTPPLMPRAGGPLRIRELLTGARQPIAVSRDRLAQAPAGFTAAESGTRFPEVMSMAKDHGSSVKNDKQYEGLRKKGMSKSRAAAISNSPGSSSRGGKKSGGGGGSGGGTKEGQRKGGRKSGSKSS
jgi:UDP-glucose 4-epimerase